MPLDDPFLLPSLVAVLHVAVAVFVASAAVADTSDHQLAFP